MENFDISEAVRITTIYALRVLDEILNEEVGSADISPAALKKNTDAIQSSIVKLGKKKSGFSAQELKVIYWAVRDMRDTLSGAIDDADTLDEREVCIKDSRNANAILRFWREVLNSFDEGRKVLAFLNGSP